MSEPPVTQQAEKDLAIGVVVCTRNRARKLEECLRSLGDQSLDPSRYEIVVVDDCSTDATAATAQRFDIHLIRNERNLGPAASRNSGAEKVAASIIAFIDDDCVADRDWLRELVGAFADSDVVAVGGEIRPLHVDRLLLRYYEESPPLAHTPNRQAHGGGLFERFVAYLRRSFRLGRLGAKQEDLLTIASANLGIRRQEFEVLGGFDERFGVGGEDDDLCLRLRRLRPAGRLLYVPNAVVAHDYDPSFRDALRRNRAYGRAAAIAYLKGGGRLPAIYPFPPLILVSFALASIDVALIAVPFVLLVVFYPGWLRLAMSRRNPAYVGFASLQAFFELQTTVGFVRHLAHERRLRPRPKHDPAAN
jgi:GT2 family glycosyltransferase